MNSDISDLKKADAIKRVVARYIQSGGWQSECGKDASAWLDKSERSRRKDVIAYIAEQYTAAGLDSRGEEGRVRHG